MNDEQKNKDWDLYCRTHFKSNCGTMHLSSKELTKEMAGHLLNWVPDIVEIPIDQREENERFTHRSKLKKVESIQNAWNECFKEFHFNFLLKAQIPENDGKYQKVKNWDFNHQRRCIFCITETTLYNHTKKIDHYSSNWHLENLSRFLDPHTNKAFLRTIKQWTESVNAITAINKRQNLKRKSEENSRKSKKMEELEIRARLGVTPLTPAEVIILNQRYGLDSRVKNASSVRLRNLVTTAQKPVKKNAPMKISVKGIKRISLVQEALVTTAEGFLIKRYYKGFGERSEDDSFPKSLMCLEESTGPVSDRNKQLRKAAHERRNEKIKNILRAKKIQEYQLSTCTPKKSSHGEKLLIRE